MIPERSVYRGQSYKLFEDYNEIHVFVEDNNFENLYKVLFLRMGLRIQNVFSRNGKREVLKDAERCTDKKCVYLVDRDWDDYHGTVPTLENVFVLEKHSIENYLIDYETFCGILIAEYPESEINTLLSNQNFNDILEEASNSLRPLFECFLAVQCSGQKLKNCSIKPGHFEQENQAKLADVNKINQYIQDTNVEIKTDIIDFFNEPELVNKGHGKFMLHYVWQGVKNKIKNSGMPIGGDKLLIRLGQITTSRDVQNLVNGILAVRNRA